MYGDDELRWIDYLKRHRSAKSSVKFTLLLSLIPTLLSFKFSAEDIKEEIITFYILLVLFIFRTIFIKHWIHVKPPKPIRANELNHLLGTKNHSYKDSLFDPEMIGVLIMATISFLALAYHEGYL